MSIQNILRKYNSVNGSDLLGVSSSPNTTLNVGNVVYKLYPKGAIVHKDGNGTHVVLSKTPAFLSTWVGKGLCGGVGMPIEDSREIGDGIGWVQGFEQCIMYWHSDLIYKQNAVVVRRGEFLDKWGELGRESGELGYPITDERFRYTEHVNMSIKEQLFQNGKIVVFKNEDTDESYCMAFPNNGYALPRRDYSLRLLKVFCKKETSGFGSDEFNMTTCMTRVGGETNNIRWSYGDFDSGESREPNLVLYEGSLPTALNFSLLGLEKDGPRALSKALNHFESTVRVLDSDLDMGSETPDIFGRGIAVGVLIDLIATAIAGGTISVGVSGTGAITLTTSGSISGGLIGLIAAAALISIFLGVDFRKPELIMIDRTTFIAEIMTPIILSGVTMSEPIVVSTNGIRIEISYESADPGQLIERRVYSSDKEESVYELELMHTLDVG